MNKFIKYTTMLVLGVGLLLTSCTEDWEEMNENPNQPTDPPAQNMLAFTIRHISQEYYDAWFDMNTTETYVGHLGKIQYIDESRYEYRAGVINGLWYDTYQALNNLKTIRETAKEEGKTNMQAVSLVMHVYITQIATDTWKAMPYSEAIQGAENTNPAYDTQEAIYQDLLSKLEEANGLFDPTQAAGNIIEGDILLNNSVGWWQKFCNSLRLRVANRLSEVEPSTAQNHIETVLTKPDQYPILSSNDENVQLQWPGSSPHYEPWYYDRYVDNRDDHGMGKPFIDSLKSFNDPRIATLADTNKNGRYSGVVPGAPDGSFSMDTISRIGDYYRHTPNGYTFFMRYPEVCFIIAEAGNRGWDIGSYFGGSAQSAYEAGVKASMLEHSASGQAGSLVGSGIPEISETDMDDYLAQPKVQWGSGTFSNHKKIILQKWMSLFKQGHEAWAEVRRTDIPLRPEAPGSPYGNHNRCPFRYPYPTDEFNLNSANIEQFAEGIVDQFWGQQMYWDTRTGVE